MTISNFRSRLNQAYKQNILGHLCREQIEQRHHRQEQWKIGIANLRKALDELDVLLDTEGDSDA